MEVNSELIIRDICRTYKHLTGKGPEKVEVDFSKDLVVLRLHGILVEAQNKLLKKEPYHQILKQYTFTLLQEVIIPELGEICSSHIAIGVKYWLDKFDIEENLLIVVFCMNTANYISKTKCC